MARNLDKVFLSEEMLESPEVQDMASHALNRLERSGSVEPPGEASTSQREGNPPANQADQSEPAPSFDQCLEYSRKVKQRSQEHPELFRRFCNVLQEYTKGRADLEDTRRNMADIFVNANSVDLYEEFEALMIPQYKARIDQRERQLLTLMAGQDVDVQPTG